MPGINLGRQRMQCHHTTLFPSYSLEFLIPSFKSCPSLAIHALVSPCCAKLNGIFACPLSSCCLVARTIGLVDMCDFWHERVVGIRVCKHGADGEEHCGLGVSILVEKNQGKRRDRAIPFEMVRAGLHWSLKMSRQMLPLELMLGW